MELRTLDQLDLTNKKVLVRLDLNVPLRNGKVSDDNRITAALPTIKHILSQTNKVVLCSHLGRPKGEPNAAYSLAPVGEYLAGLLEREVVFIEDYLSEPAEQVLNQLSPNQIILLENLRFHAGEEKNSDEFSRMLASGFDYFVNDAFGTLHRAHASTVGVTKLFEPQHRAAGFLVSKEINVLGNLLKRPSAPFTVVIGGAKVSDKMEVMLSLLNSCNRMLIGGAMAYSFLKFKGIEVGKSMVEQDKMELVGTIYRNAEEKNVEILVPVDHVAASSFSESAVPTPIPEQHIPSDLMGLDIGPKTLQRYSELISSSKMVLWNGPMGVFEWPAFASGTFGIAKAMAESNAETIIGGGDSVAAVNQAGLGDRMSHISTGGGASLEFLEGKMLPGVRVLMK